MLHPHTPIQHVPADWATYFPNWVEWSVTMGALAGMFLIITLFSKFFPMMAVWEVEEGVKINHEKETAAEIRKQMEAEINLQLEVKQW